MGDGIYGYFDRRIDPKALLNNQLLANYGQLVQIRFARIVSVFPPSMYIIRRSKKRMCECHLSPEEITEVNNNPLKIFKNFASYAPAAAKGSLQYSVMGEVDKDLDSFC